MAIDVTAVSLTELRYAVAAADHLHFGRAARACHVTQPTLSAQIQKLERTLGVQIFERTSKSVRLTSIGRIVVEEARGVLAATQRLTELATSERDPLSGPLALGVIPTLAPYLLPWLVPPLVAAFPRLELAFREQKTSDCLDDLAHHRLDAAILALPVSGTGLVAQPLFAEPFWFLVPKQHPLSRRKRVSLPDLAGERVLLLEEGHCLRDQALEICDRARVQREPTKSDFRATSLETLRHMVAAGMGTTLIPALALDEEASANGAVPIPFAAPAPTRTMGLVTRRTHPRASDFRALADFIRASLPASVTRA